MVPAIPVPFPFRPAFGELTTLVNATGVGPDIESMFDTAEEVVLHERWLASAVSLGAGKWAVVNAEEDSVQVKGGCKVSIRIFEIGSLQGRGRLRGLGWFKANMIAVFPGWSAGAGGRREVCSPRN